MRPKEDGGRHDRGQLWIASFVGLVLAAWPARAQEPEPSAGGSAEPGADGDSAASVPTAGYDKGFFIRSADSDLFELVINGRIQGRFAFESVEEHLEAETTGDAAADAAEAEASAGTEREEEYAFSVPRARLKLKGHAFRESLGYALQVEFGKGNTYLKDYYVDAGLVPGSLHLRVGQYKRPFSRQQITSSGK